MQTSLKPTSSSMMLSELAAELRGWLDAHQLYLDTSDYEDFLSASGYEDDHLPTTISLYRRNSNGGGTDPDERVVVETIIDW